MEQVNTVLGPVPAAELGLVAVHEALLDVFPGAQYGYDIVMDRSEIFARIAGKLRAFKAAGGGTVVDANGMFAGRDLPLYEALSKATGVHVIASAGQMEEGMLGGYFLTPQENPPVPWPTEKFAELYANEVSKGMVVPRVERRAPAGLLVVGMTRDGATPTDESQLAGAARAAAATGVPLSIRYGGDPVAALELAFAEGREEAGIRVVVGDVDRRDRASQAGRIARRGGYVALDHVGSAADEYLSDDERVALVADLIARGHVDRVLVSVSATGAAFGGPGNDRPYELVLTSFIPRLRAAGVADDDIDRIVVRNPGGLLTVRN